jgi:environmental stress-induced protein Ves
VVLTIDGEENRLDKLYRPLRFRGESKVEGRLIDGPVRDLNIMTRRERQNHTITIVGERARWVALPVKNLTMVIPLAGGFGDASQYDAIVVTEPSELSDDRSGDHSVVCIAHVQ